MTTDITELAQSMKRRATSANEFGESLYVKADDVLALVEALASEKRICATWRKTAEANSEKLEKAQQRLAELESSGVAPGILRCTECSFVLTKNIISVTAYTITTVESESEPCPNGCGQLLPATWKALAIHLMFTTKQGVSDLLEAKKRIAELESRTVKLPDDEDGQAYGFGKWANGKLPATAGTMTIAYCEDAWRAAFEVFSSAAGIKVEAE